tara:strand:+ start:7528 stop:7989 length:462 start_codon:yes stop_codon:yes gene_type:complete
MSRNKQTIELYQKALNLCRTAKLSYLKSADKEHLPEHKRFLNLQATIRNRIYNDLITALNGTKIELGASFHQNHNREQIMIANLLSEKKNAFSKAIESDESLIEQIIKLLSVEENLDVQDKLIRFIDKLKNSLGINKSFEETTFTLNKEEKVS